MKFLRSNNSISLVEKLVTASILIFCLASAYFVIGHSRNDLFSSKYLLTIIDHKIPFIASSVWFYLFGLYLNIIILIILIKKRRNYYHLCLTILTTNILCFIAFIYFPIPYPRPTISSPILLANLNFTDFFRLTFEEINLLSVKTMYDIDSNLNTFPSLHIVYAMIIYLGIRCEYKNLSKLFAINLILLYFSTLTTKQHFLVDGIVGASLAFLVFKFWERLFRRYFSI